ncbi:hypothetical protein ACA910_009880 [Epithemia clementina (nom. ined.)]
MNSFSDFYHNGYDAGYDNMKQSWYGHDYNEDYDFVHDLPPLEDEEYEGGWRGLLHRFLAEKDKKEAGRMDYSALSVAVMTLGLILVVEVLRHRLDHWALGRPYCMAVLENIYAELTTLGIVEFFVFLLQRYHTKMNKAKKGVFGDVHFALFYTAVLNAFQSMILAFITTRVSNRIWVQTEALELNHYVELREEFERVRDLLFKPNSIESKKEGGDSSSTSSDDPKHGDEPTLSNNRRNIDASSDISWKGLKSFVSSLVDQARRPRLWYRYNGLLIQVRFHDLRVHFLESYNLPRNFKVSDYLVRCQLHVLIKLVHVSAVAWLLLTASFNLLYFILGVVGYFEQSTEVVGEALVFVFYVALFGFVALALLVFKKMKDIFRQIMHRNELWGSTPTEERHLELAKEQMQFFWFGSPKLVISALQFMQFGYAVALAAVLMFWETIDDFSIGMGWYFMAIVLCYAIFVAVAAHVIPRYTLCTSLGQLVDKERLNQTVAKFHLDEARRQRGEHAYLDAYNEQHPLLSYQSTLLESQSNDQQSRRTSISSASSHDGRNNYPSNLEMDLEGMDKQPTKISAAEERFNSRHARRRQKKSVSDGVALMAAIKDGSFEEGEEEEEEEKTEVEDGTKLSTDFNRAGDLAGTSLLGQTDAAARIRRNRRKAVSDGVAAMANMKPRSRLERSDNSQLQIADLVNVDTASLRQNLPQVDGQKLEMKKQFGTKRTKSKSDPDKMKRMAAKDNGADFDEATSEKRRANHPVIASLTATLGFRHASPEKNDDKQDDENDNDIDDNLSDVDDIPMVDMAYLTERRIAKEQHKKLAFKEKCKQYFLSKKFPVFSNVFGTMVAFFLIGSRVERFLHTQDIVPRDFISFDFNETATFWILSCYFFLFIVFDCLAVYSIDQNDSSRKSRVRWLGSIMDIVIVAVCWIVLWVAEIQRCCNPSDATTQTRGLAGEDDKYSYKYIDKYDNDYGPAPCSCPTFGSRLYGGLGTIEPYTSLVALRLFRFFIARKVLGKRNRQLGILPSDEELEAHMEEENNLDPFNVAEDKHHDDHGAHDHGHGDHGHHGAHRGTAAELWETAIAQHPEIVEQYGMFSSEMLQIMLGLPLPKHATNSNHGALKREEHNICEDAITTAANTPHRFRIEKKYSTLSLGAQEIIMQGKLGKTVRTISNLDNLDSVQTIPEDAVTQRGPSYMFHVADDVSVSPPSNLEQLLFDSPNARLVRTMRRCDRKLLPMLNKWTVVDVVMTRFEMVYFDATDRPDTPEADSIFQALKATKGGKGLRLKDVAVGRKVVGHMPISDITSLAIERYLPGESQSGSDEGPEAEVPEVEHWKEGTLHYSRKAVWSKIKQDTLAVHSAHGNTLYLRFYSDLEQAEALTNRSPDDVDQGDHFTKNNAFQWVQTLGRFCGPERLHQSLPHFGEDNEEELRDYLVVHQNNEHKRNLNFLANHGPHMREHETVGAVSERSTKRMSMLRLPSFKHASIPVEDSAAAATAPEGDAELGTNPSSNGRSGSQSPPRRSKSMSPFRRSNSVGDPAVDSPTLSHTNNSTTGGSARGLLKRPKPIIRSQSLGENSKPGQQTAEKMIGVVQQSELKKSSSKANLMPTLPECEAADNTSTSNQHDDISPV